MGFITRRILFYLLLTVSFSSSYGKQPHIIFIYADDLGWNDVSFHGSPQIPTPNLDALAMSGVLLNNYYGMWLCTPSRGAFMTGKYPIRLGLQHNVLKSGEASGLPLEEKTIAQHLKGLGYATHMIGKWHLGYQSREYTPTYRGFDSYFGYYNGFVDYYDFTFIENVGLNATPYFYGIDIKDGLKSGRDSRGEYATRLFTRKATQLINNHNASQPMFLYMSHLAVHSGNPYYPFQAPPETIDKFKHIKGMQRRIFAAMTYELDASVGKIFQALNRRGMLSDTIVVFASDNGAEAAVLDGQGSNFPLRGLKYTLHEGGNRVPAFVWSPLLKLKKPKISDALMHVTDMCPTIYRMAGGNPKTLGKIDGYDFWETLKSDQPPPRKGFLYNIDPVFGVSAYRQGHMKVINGTSIETNDWYGATGTEDGLNPKSMSRWVFRYDSTVRNILKRKGWWIVEDPDSWYGKSTLRCLKPPPESAYKCQPDVKPCLFNVTADPCEYTDMAEKFPKLTRKLMKRISAYAKVQAPPQTKPSDPNADPQCYNFEFVPWMDKENPVQCTYTKGGMYKQ